MDRESPPDHGGSLRLAEEKYSIPPDQWIDFSANLNPLGPPPVVQNALAARLGELRHYPDPEAVAFRQILSHRLGVPFSSTRALNGAAEGIFLIFQVWRPERVVVAAPTFSEYERAARAVGAAVQRVEIKAHPIWRRYELDLHSLLFLAGRFQPGTILVLANPNNPTGHALEREDLKVLLHVLRQRGARLLLDEAFLDFLPDGKDRSLVSEAADSGDLVVIGSLTKFYALPGLRVGWIVAAPPLLEEMDRLRDPWSVNHLAQVAGKVVLQQAGDYERQTRRLIALERYRLEAELSSLGGLRVWKGSANFLLLDTLPPWPAAAELVDLLARRGLLVRDASNFPGLTHRHLRVAVRLPHENDRLLAALKEITAELGDVLGGDSS